MRPGVGAGVSETTAAFASTAHSYEAVGQPKVASNVHDKRARKIVHSWPPDELSVRIADAVHDAFESAYDVVPVTAKQWSGEQYTSYMSQARETTALSSEDRAALLFLSVRDNVHALHECWMSARKSLKKRQRGANSIVTNLCNIVLCSIFRCDFYTSSVMRRSGFGTAVLCRDVLDEYQSEANA